MALCTADELEVPVNTVRGVWRCCLQCGAFPWWVLPRVSLTWGSVLLRPFLLATPFPIHTLSPGQNPHLWRQLCLRQAGDFWQNLLTVPTRWKPQFRAEFLAQSWPFLRHLTSLNYCHKELDVQNKNKHIPPLCQSCRCDSVFAACMFVSGFFWSEM